MKGSLTGRVDGGIADPRVNNSVGEKGNMRCERLAFAPQLARRQTRRVHSPLTTSHARVTHIAPRFTGAHYNPRTYTTIPDKRQRAPTSFFRVQVPEGFRQVHRDSDIVRLSFPFDFRAAFND